MPSGLWLPVFEELAEPRAVASLASDSQELGWRGLFVWDQLRAGCRPRRPLRVTSAAAPANQGRTTMDYDAELRLLNEVLRHAYALRWDDDVLDIGCGTGETTRAAARTASDGRVVGIDSSAAMIERARELTEEEGLRNVTFVLADAQRYPFSPGSFDLAISRFGTMFFRDPVAAFANIAQALRRDGRLVMMVWQAQERNEWATAIARALGGDDESLSAAPQGSDPFSLADPDTVTRTLGAAGFTDVTFTDVGEPVYYGPDIATALDWVSGFACTNEVMRTLDSPSTELALGRLRDMLGRHSRADGIWFDARAWIVAARRDPNASANPAASAR